MPRQHPARSRHAAVARFEQLCDAAAVWTRIDDVPSGDQARPWVFGVARNVLANHRRGARRRDALAARLRADLRFVPASPTVVGNLVYLDSDVTSQGTDDRDVEVVDSPEQCTLQGGGRPVGVSIPEGYSDPIELVFGREPEPGEAYDTTNSATAPGEALEGVDLTDMTVGELRRILADRDQETVEYRQTVSVEPPPSEDGDSGVTGSDESPAPADEMEFGRTDVIDGDEAGDDWLVEHVILWAPGQVAINAIEPS
ncbi:hypothetical protein [Nocardiopsis sp. FIRDI 009]|uniref:hypothetical protein n=1 Tax=Nocardiopsis sp. FIRDI 009 TaxID=714197 RepID=UPI00351720C1